MPKIMTPRYAMINFVNGANASEVSAVQSGHYYLCWRVPVKWQAMLQ